MILKTPTKILAEAVVAIALGFVLSFIIVYRLPQGGSITAASMVPLLWFALRRGAKYGVVAGAIYGLGQFAQDPFAVHPVQVLLDYPIAFGALGLAGLLAGTPLAGVTVGVAGRFVSHFLSGIVFFAAYAPAGQAPWVYSAIYNGSYLVPELVMSVIVMYILVNRRIIELYR